MAAMILKILVKRTTASLLTVMLTPKEDNWFDKFGAT